MVKNFSSNFSYNEVRGLMLLINITKFIANLFREMEGKEFP